MINNRTIKEIESDFNKMSHQERLKAIYALKPKEQNALYEMCIGRFCSLDFFVPKERYGSEVIHWGVNSLPVFQKFQKTMSAKEENGVISYSGYNEQIMKTITGPGYFTLKEVANGPHDKKQVVVDYINPPSFKLDSWPKIIPNKARLSRVIYYMTNDWMWQVSEHVSIGKASRDGKFMNNWFVLCRED